jgi:hypothetical protein
MAKQLGSGSPGWQRKAVLASVMAGAALILATAVIHLHLWLSGYRHVPRLGVLFLAQSIAGFVLAPVIAATRRSLSSLIGAGYMGSSAGALILSAIIGFVGVHDSLGVPWAGWALSTELAGVVLLGSAGLAVACRR